MSRAGTGPAEGRTAAEGRRRGPTARGEAARACRAGRAEPEAIALPRAGRLPRRAALACLLALAGCGFAPALAPGGRGRIAVEAPDTRAGFALRGRLLDRLGSPDPRAPYRLAVEVAIEPEIAAVDPAQVTTRVRLEGGALYALTAAETGEVLLEGSATAFTSYDAAGTTVALDASARDAQERLMVILADRIAARLLAADLP